MRGGRTVKFKKRVLCRLAAPYAVASWQLDGSPCIGAATEGEGPTLLFEQPFNHPREILCGPGGCMAILPDPELPSSLYVIQGCFPGFRFQGGGVYGVRREPGGAWVSARIADLPFIHRIDLVRRGAHRYLLAANLAQDKRDAADWTRPGSLWAAELPGDGRGTAGAVTGPAGLLTLTPVLEGISRNHGMTRACMEGRDTILLSGTEGVFAVDLESESPAWKAARLLDHEVSEQAFLDLDGDGRDELATIEPFHGNLLRVYRGSGAAWHLMWEAEIAFGHGLVAALLDGRPSLVVANRAGSKDLVAFCARDPGAWHPERVVVDAASGTANSATVTVGGRVHLVSANQAAGELALYAPV
jgi:hypothetical protein